MSSLPATAPERLLADSAWLRNLARRLTGDVDLAADLEQEVALAALREPDPARIGRSWLTTVARNLQALLHRRSRREQERIRWLEPGGHAPSASELVATAEQQQRAASAVLRLPELYRETILLRFMHGMSLQEAARHLREPAETVRTRQKRGLALLRAELLPEERRTRSRAFAAFGLLTCGVAMKAKSAITAGVLVCLLLGSGAVLWSLQGGAATGPAEGPAAPVVAKAPAPERVASPESPAPASPRTEVITPPPSSPSPKQEAATLRVLLVAAGKPIAGAGIVCRDEGTAWQQASTDAAGEVLFTGLDAGHWFVNGADTRQERVRLRKGEQGSVTLQREPGTTVSGRVVDPDGAPVAGAQLFTRQGGMTPSFEFAAGSTDAQGRFRLSDLVENTLVGAREVRLGVSDCEVVRPMHREASAPELVLRLPGTGTASLRGRVVDRNQRAIAGVWVELRQGGVARPLPDGRMIFPPGSHLCTTDADGRFHAEGLRPGPRTVFAYLEGFAPASSKHTLAPHQTFELEVTLLRGALLSGTVRDASGQLLTGAMVRTTDYQLQFPLQLHVITGKDGAFRFPDLAPGEIEFAIQKDGVGGCKRKFTVTADETHEWPAVLSPDANVKGRLVDHRGEPLARWNVQRASGDGWTQTGADGRFVVTGCAAEGNELVFRSEPFRPEMLRVQDVRPRPAEQRFVVPAEALAKGTIRGQCQGQDGSPMPGVRVNLIQSYSVVAPEVKTPADGTFNFDSLPPGKYQLTFQHPQHRTWQREVSLESGATSELGLVQPGAPSTGR